jgi:hypothetical protein
MCGLANSKLCQWQGIPVGRYGSVPCKWAGVRRRSSLRDLGCKANTGDLAHPQERSFLVHDMLAKQRPQLFAMQRCFCSKACVVDPAGMLAFM